jgi:hypothetical protein
VLAMTDRICPLNNRTCRCDPNATDNKFHPCALAKRIGKLIRLLGSNFEGEAIGAASGLRRLAQSEGLAFNDLATLIENCDGQIEEKKYSDADAEVIFARGAEKGRAEEARKREAPPEFYDADGQPRWYEIAMYCQQNRTQLRDEWERNFANDIPSRIIKYGRPTERMIPHLLAIFVKLGGHYDPKTAHVRR